MIKEFKNEDLLHQESAVFKKYFVDKQLSDKEKENTNKLSNLLLHFYQKLYGKETKSINDNIFNYDFYTYGYLENYGYYVINHDNCSYYLIKGYEDNIQNAFISLAIKVLDKKAEEYIRSNRKLLKKDFKNRFPNIKYIDSLYIYEYELLKWKEYFDGIIPQLIIDEYNKHFNYDLNNNEIKFKYDQSSNKFVTSENAKTKKLIKQKKA